ncbi:MAG: hypothetical protein QM796_04305 [Chthoniobacteraceae bacterium]
MKKIIFLIIPVLVLANLAAFFLLRQPALPADDELTKPILAEQAMQAKHPFTSSIRPLISTPPAIRRLAQAGPPEERRRGDPHRRPDDLPATCWSTLLHVQDWNLTYLDHTSFGFKRAPVAGWNIATLKDLEKRFADKPTPERVDFPRRSCRKARLCR